MRARVWGCRGSLAAPGPETIRYGGNTSCVEVRLESGELLVLDAGTGMRPLGVALDGENVSEVHILLTHLHLDHLQGLGFFRPFFQPEMNIHIWGPPSPVQGLAERIAMYLSPPLFPVRLADVPSNVTFHDACEERFDVGSGSVRACAVTHQGPTVGYRITEGERSLVYLPDHEPSLGVPDLESYPEDWISGLELAAGADVLLHDAQYGDDEYDRHVGWGHSAIAHVVAFARKADVGRLVLFHHDPYHSDHELERLLGEARELWSAERVCAAWETMEITVTPDVVAIPECPSVTI
jgi:phosphoribosyl 1,2-cyclic phosphodiesterase